MSWPAPDPAALWLVCFDCTGPALTPLPCQGTSGEWTRYGVCDPCWAAYVRRVNRGELVEP